MSSFDRFPREGFEFLTGLGADNSKAFFDEHRDTYVEAVATPSRLFVERMTPLLQDAVHRDLRGEAKVGRSLFRINRDVRFARDKTRGPALNRYHALLANPVDGPESRAASTPWSPRDHSSPSRPGLDPPRASRLTIPTPTWHAVTSTSTTPLLTRK